MLCLPVCLTVQGGEKTNVSKWGTKAGTKIVE